MAFNFIGWHYWWSPDILSVTWSICVEEQFYLVFPIVFLCLNRVPKYRTWFVCVSVLLAISVRYWFIYLPLNHADVKNIGTSSGLYYFTLSYTEMFVFGAVAGHIHLWRVDSKPEAPMMMLALFVAALAGTYPLMISWASSIWPPYTWYSPLIYTGLGVSLSALVYSVAASPSAPQSVLLRLYPVRVLGFLSYCMYLVHLSMQRIVVWWHEGVGAHIAVPWAIHLTITFIYLTAATVAISSILHVLVERPFMLLIRGKSRPIAKGLSSATVPWKTTLGISLLIVILCDTVYWKALL